MVEEKRKQKIKSNTRGLKSCKVAQAKAKRETKRQKTLFAVFLFLSFPTYVFLFFSFCFDILSLFDITLSLSLSLSLLPITTQPTLCCVGQNSAAIFAAFDSAFKRQTLLRSLPSNCNAIFTETSFFPLFFFCSFSKVALQIFLPISFLISRARIFQNHRNQKSHKIRIRIRFL